MLDLLKRVTPDNKEIAKEINVEVMMATANLYILFEAKQELDIIENLKTIFSAVERMENEKKKLKYLDIVIDNLKGL